MKTTASTLVCFLSGIALLWFTQATPVHAQPLIAAGGILNAASYGTPGLPHADIAQGSMFVVFGQGMGPQTLQQAPSFPLPTQLAGTSIRIVSGAVTADAIMIYSSAGQVAAILPSRVPVGDATLTLTYNGQTSAGVRFRVARSSLGIFTRNQGGSGPGIVQNYVSATEQPLNALTETAAPSQVAILWATGLGPVDSDETRPPQAGDLDVPVDILVAGKSARVLYKGRSPQFPGVDQLNFELPADTPLGCYVPVAIKAGGVVSNFITISVAASRGVCADVVGLSAADVGTASTTGQLRTATIVLSKMNSLSYSTGVYDEIDGNFLNYSLAILLSRTRLMSYFLPFGVCTVISSKVAADNPLDVTENPGGWYTALDVGTALNVTGPRGTKTLVRSSMQDYFGGVGGGIPGFTDQFGPEYLVPGAYTVNNGTGSASVGPFQATLTLPSLLTWTNQNAITEVRRSQELTITWSGADSSKEYVLIQGLSTNTGIGGGSLFSCVERASAGQFTVPAYVLSALPASGTMGPGAPTIPSGYLRVANVSTLDAFRFQAVGLDVATVGYMLANLKLLAFQ